MSLRPFFSYYGGKWRAAPRYPAPIFDTIVEPFAGSAGYATRHYGRRVRLADADRRIAGVWRFLTTALESEIRALPLTFDHVDEVRAPIEARWLIGFWLNKGSAGPRKTPSAWMRAGRHVGSFWGERVRDRIASQVRHIRHWRIEEADYRFAHVEHRLSSGLATWFIDPPYIDAGKHYAHHDIDYAALGRWCRSLPGQAIVCEADGADWLPFRPHMTAKATAGGKRSRVCHEVIWTSNLGELSEVT